MSQHGDHWDAETKQLFDTLPKMVQESIMQSGVWIQNADQLKKLADRLTKAGDRENTQN